MINSIFLFLEKNKIVADTMNSSSGFYRFIESLCILCFLRSCGSVVLFGVCKIYYQTKEMVS